MHKFSKAAAAAAATGLAVLGTVAVGGGVANAATNQSAASCSVGAVVLEAGVLPSCQAGDTTVNDPTGFTVTASTSSPVSGLLGAVGTLLNNLDANSDLLSGLTSALTENVSFTLSCKVGGQTVTKAESYTNLTDGVTREINLQTAVGSPAPNSCQVQDFTVHSPISLSLLDLTLLNGVSGSVLNSLGGLLGTTPLTGLNSTDLGSLLGLSVSAKVTADTATPGAVWAKAGTTKAGNTADICADDAGNLNASSAGQVYQCNSDLAQYWVQSSTGQLVHNGVCLTQSGSVVKLANCSSTNQAQVWNVKGTGGNFNEIVNEGTGNCLTWPSAKNFTALKVGACTGKAGALWTGPAKSAV
jgi:hypothetical protein